jgi:hypothetical protein
MKAYSQEFIFSLVGSRTVLWGSALAFCTPAAPRQSRNYTHIHMIGVQMDVDVRVVGLCDELHGLGCCVEQVGLIPAATVPAVF